MRAYMRIASVVALSLLLSLGTLGSGNAAINRPCVAVAVDAGGASCTIPLTTQTALSYTIIAPNPIAWDFVTCGYLYGTDYVCGEYESGWTSGLVTNRSIGFGDCGPYYTDCTATFTIHGQGAAVIRTSINGF